VKLFRTIQLDASDSLVFEKPAEPAEWAVSGAFAFARDDPSNLRGKVRSAFWYVGLSSEATGIGDAIWHGGDLGDVARNQLVGLFRVTFRDAVDAVQEIQDEPEFRLMAMTADAVLRLKPQNLIAGLPIRYVEAVK
jgi:hypothetical protein